MVITFVFRLVSYIFYIICATGEDYAIWLIGKYKQKFSLSHHADKNLMIRKPRIVLPRKQLNATLIMLSFSFCDQSEDSSVVFKVNHV